MNRYQLLSSFIWRTLHVLLKIHLEETSILYWLLLISFHHINLMNNRGISSNQEVLWKIPFLDNSGKSPEKKQPWRSPFFVKLLACSFTKNSTMDIFVGVFSKFSEQLINRQINSRRLSLKQVNLCFERKKFV